ncbi:MAG: DNA recombination protein RmuC [Candidatus Omnitrophota bacterium]
MIEAMVLFLLVILIILAVFILWRTTKKDNTKDKLEALLNERFIDFSDRLRQSMESTRQEVERSKDALSSGTVKTLEHIKGMSETVNNLVRQQEKVQQLGQSLEYLLQTPKLRGSYGEAILEEMLERVLPKGIWEKQYMIEGNERVDAVVKYKDVIIPIDSKFPKDDYQKYLAVTSPQEKKLHWANYEKALKIQINSIKDKYIKPEKGTTDFALLFIPSEAIYYETIAEKNYLGDPCSIYEYAARQKVIPVSPNTFYAFLQIIILGIRNIEIAREAKKLQESLSRIEKDFSFFHNKFEQIGKALAGASKAYETGEGHIRRFKKNLESTLKLEKNFLDDSERELLVEHKADDRD